MQSFADVLQIKCFKDFASFSGKGLCWSNFLKKRPQNRIFPKNIYKELLLTVGKVFNLCVCC